MMAIDPGIRIRTTRSLPWTRTETACRYDAPENRLNHLRRRVEPARHRELPLLDDRVRDPAPAAPSCKLTLTHLGHLTIALRPGGEISYT
jgi:hypothetical protein